MEALLRWVYVVSAIVPLALYFGGLGLLSMTPPDFTTSRWFVSVACIWIGAAGLLWGFGTSEALLVRCVVGLGIGAVVFCIWPGTFRYIARRELVVSAAPVRAAVVPAQIRELQQVAEFLGGKDENGLREVFDFSNILKFNVRLAKSGLDPNGVTQAQRDEMNNFFAGGGAIVSMRYAHVYDDRGRAKIDWIPGKIGAINLSKKYKDSRQLLLPFETSPQMPTDIQRAIKDFDDTVAENIDPILFDVLNEKLSQDPGNILYMDDMSFPQYGVIPGAYAAKFKQLKPKADIVLGKIRAFLKVD